MSLGRSDVELVQPADRAEVEVQIFGVELEALGDLMDRLLELHERKADVLDLLGGQRLLFKRAGQPGAPSICG